MRTETRDLVIPASTDDPTSDPTEGERRCTAAAGTSQEAVIQECVERVIEALRAQSGAVPAELPAGSGAKNSEVA